MIKKEGDKLHVLISDQGMLTFDQVREYEGEPFYLAMQHGATNFMVMVRKLSNRESKNNKDDIYYYINSQKTGSNSYEPCIMLYMLNSFEQADAIITSYRRAIKELHEMVM